MQYKQFSSLGNSKEFSKKNQNFPDFRDFSTLLTVYEILSEDLDELIATDNLELT